MSDLPDPVRLAVPFFVMLVVAELIYARLTKKTGYEPRDTFGSLMMGFGSTVSGVLLGGTIGAISAWVAAFRILDIGYVWWAWILCFVADDFLYYVFHRSAHRVRLFWASHVNHHSSQHYNLSTALRQTWTGFFAVSFIFRLPLFLIGFPPAMVFFCAGLNLVYQFWIHTEAIGKCPRWFEAVMNTPSHHRVHHATNAPYLDANYAGVFILWDRLFGSFVAEGTDGRCRYGLVHNLGTFNPLRIAFHEWAGMLRDLTRARSLRDILGYTLGPPGWSPDGRRDTSASLKARFRQRRGPGGAPAPQMPVAGRDPPMPQLHNLPPAL
jgi:sterol desaturase/sphingolipid hydroxylase (fatty acid hydroxylase superfamily)